MTVFHIRDAEESDCRDIAALFLLSSDGLAEYIWEPTRQPGETLLDAGARRYARRETAFSFENCQVAEQSGRIVGMVHGFPMIEDEDFDLETVDPVLRPYAALEDYGSFYLSSLAVYEAHQGRGIGTELMAAAVRRARSLSLPRTTLICFEGNVGALKLYRRLGYSEIDRRPVVPHPCLHYQDGDAVLMVRPVEP